MVEAPGVDLESGDRAKLLMARSFCSQRVVFSRVRGVWRLHSSPPRVPSCRPESWRHCGDEVGLDGMLPACSLTGPIRFPIA